MKSKIFNALIIGAGKMGAFYDSPETKNVLSHAHGFSKHPGFNLIGFVDTDFKKAQSAAEIWNCKPIRNIKGAFTGSMIDIACIAAPDEYHHLILKELSCYPLKFIFTEKPLAKTVNEAEEILNIYKESNISLGINYSRRYVKEFISLKEDINNLKYGEYITGSAYYGKGILHNGSHVIDLLRFLIDEIHSAESIDGYYDFYNDDPSITAIINFNNGKQLFLQHVDCNLYTVFELELFFSSGKIRITNSGFNIEIYDVRDNPLYKGYKSLNKSMDIETTLGGAVYSAIDNIYNFLCGNADLKCNAHDGLRAVEICCSLKEKIKKSS